MSWQEFRDQDGDYRRWLATHPDGYVINIRRGHNPSDARLHHARCWTINGDLGKALTDQYVKVCSIECSELERWASDHAGGPIQRCGTCHPARDQSSPRAARRTAELPPATGRKQTRDDDTALEGRAEITGPSAGRPIVEAWAEDYIHFDHAPAWQKQLGAQIRARVSQLDPAPDEILKASFFGAKRQGADVENLLIYNVGTFGDTGRFGLRFESANGAARSPDGREYPYRYRYELEPRGGGFSNWRDARQLANWDWVDLGAFAGEKKLAQVWLALRRTDVVVADLVRSADAPFCLRLLIRPPRGRTPVIGTLVKSIFDGVICAFQARANASNLAEVATRLAATVPAQPPEIEALLLDGHKAVLGTVPELVRSYRAGVKWDPADDMCVAGELLAEEPVDSAWAIRGEIVEVEPQ